MSANKQSDYETCRGTQNAVRDSQLGVTNRAETFDVECRISGEGGSL